MGAIFKPGILDDVTDLYIGRTGDLAPLAVKAQIKGLIIEKRILQTIAFAIRPGLLWPRECRIYRYYRAIYRTDSTLHALLKTCICHLILHDVIAALRIKDETWSAVRMDTPAPLPSFKALNPLSTEPAAYRLATQIPFLSTWKSFPAETPKVM